mgnify:CR=1 FL=1
MCLASGDKRLPFFSHKPRYCDMPRSFSGYKFPVRLSLNPYRVPQSLRKKEGPVRNRISPESKKKKDGTMRSRRFRETRIDSLRIRPSANGRRVFEIKGGNREAKPAELAAKHSKVVGRSGSQRRAPREGSTSTSRVPASPRRRTTSRFLGQADVLCRTFWSVLRSEGARGRRVRSSRSGQGDRRVS